jgi:peptidoglycan/LPS O-acetylase OafA/YrhL
MTRSSEPQSLRVPAINGLRALAIIGVLWHHSFWSYFKPAPGTTAPLLNWFPLLSNGWLGVNLFFFLSGFVLYLPFVLGMRVFAARSDFQRFYERRARRMLPLFYINLCAGFFFVVHRFDGPSIIKFAISCSLLFNFHPLTFSPAANWVLWSLGLEVLFSVLFPFIVIAAERFSLNRIVVVSIVVGVAFRAVGDMFFRGPIGVGYLNFVSDSIFGRIDDFVLGMLGAAIYAGRVTLPPVVRRYATLSGVALILGAMLIWNRWFTGDLHTVFGALASSLVNVGTVLLVAGIFAGTWLDRALSIRPLQVIGMMCYSLYVWHSLLLISIYPGGPLSVAQQPWSYPLFIAGLLLISSLTYRFIEFPSVDLRSLFLPERAGQKSIRPARGDDAPDPWTRS